MIRYKLSGVMISCGLIATTLLAIGFFLPIQTKSHCSFQFDQLHFMATQSLKREELPHSTSSIPVAGFNMPLLLARVGGRLTRQPGLYQSFLLHYESSHIVIDAVHPKSMHNLTPYDTFYNIDKFNDLVENILSAKMVLFTHEHYDHISGLTAIPKQKLPKNIVLTTEQASSKAFYKSAVLLVPKESFKIINYENTLRIAPGVVLIKTPGHTPGHQFIYVTLQNNKEYLFVGDVAWVQESLDTKLGRPLAISLLFNENPLAISNQLSCLSEIEKFTNIEITLSH